ncbi:hypothetical protein RV18_GL003758 [Enterococcus termitis]|nr:hypothetical protein RV18_GL003758 [Enterococcus termitis]
MMNKLKYDEKMLFYDIHKSVSFNEKDDSQNKKAVFSK